MIRAKHAGGKGRALTRLLGLDDDALPVGGDWYTAEEVLVMLAEEVLARRPSHVIALGAGLSTLVLAAAARHYGGDVLALEHDPQVIEIAEAHLARLGFSATLIEAELMEHGPKALWYRRSALALLPDQIDLLFIDGPPMFAGRTPRHPAGRELFSRLSEDGLIVLDDAQRAKEKKTLRMWAEEYPALSQIKTKGGAVQLLRRKEIPSS